MPEEINPFPLAETDDDLEQTIVDLRVGRIIAHAVLEAASFVSELDDYLAAETGDTEEVAVADCSDEQLAALCRQRERACDAAEASFQAARGLAAEAIEEIARRGIEKTAEQRYADAAAGSGNLMPEVDANLLALVKEEMGEGQGEVPAASGE